MFARPRPWASGLNNWIHETFKVHFEGQPATWWKMNMHRKQCHVVHQGWCQWFVFLILDGYRVCLGASVWAFLIDNLNIEDTAVCLWLIWSLWYLLSLWEPAVVPVLRSCKSFVMSLIMVKSWPSSCLPLPLSQSARLLRPRVLFSMIQPTNGSPEYRQHLKSLMIPWLGLSLFMSFSLFSPYVCTRAL